jgi:hypothetical protein
VTDRLQGLAELACCFWYRYLDGQHYSLNVSISIFSEMPSGKSDGTGSFGGNDIVG